MEKWLSKLANHTIIYYSYIAMTHEYLKKELLNVVCGMNINNGDVTHSKILPAHAPTYSNRRQMLCRLLCFLSKMSFSLTVNKRTLSTNDTISYILTTLPIWVIYNIYSKRLCRRARIEEAARQLPTVSVWICVDWFDCFD